MNPTRFPKSSDPSLMDARRTAAVARAASAAVVLLGILAVAVLTACSPRIATGSRVHAVPAANAQSNDPPSSAKSTPQIWLDPTEVDEYTKYIYG